MTAETITRASLDEELITQIGRTVVPGKKNIETWTAQVHSVRERLLAAGKTDNRYVHAILSPHKISTAVHDITGDITGRNHPHLMTRFGNIQAAIRKDTKPFGTSVLDTVRAINHHTPDAKSKERAAVFAHLLGQIGIEVAALPPDTNPADQFDCEGNQAYAIAGKPFFLPLARNHPLIEAQAWTTPYANLPTLN